MRRVMRSLFASAVLVLERAALAGGGLSAGLTSEVSGTYEVTAVFPISGIGREGERTT